MLSTHDDPRSAPIDVVALRPGRIVFGRYLLQRLAGRGGMGVVWQARDEKLERLVALKFLPEFLFHDAAARDDLKRETRRSLDLTHPHIVRIHDFVEDEEMAAIAMEYVDGATLSDLRTAQDSRCFQPEELGVWTAALCAALDYAHDAARCVHRDLKPGNLMVSARGVLKVADFGISCSLHNTAARVSAWSSTGGTLGYMSPQQLMGELASPSDDIYAVGATLYELLTGKPPFHSGDLAPQIREIVPDGIAERRRKLGLPSPPIPRAWEETIAACLAKDPRQRPDSAGEIARRLGLSCSPIAESAPSLGEHLPPTICFAPTAPVSRTFPAQARIHLQKASALLSRYRWPLATALSLGIALAAWTPLHRSSAPPPPTLTAPSPATGPQLVAAPGTPASPIPAAAPGPTPLPASLGDQLALLAPIPAPSPSTLADGAAPADSPTVLIETLPAGVPFKILASAYETPLAEVLRGGETPATIRDLPPGSYRIVFSPVGAAPRSASVLVPARGSAVFHQDFPHGILKLRSQPDGAVLICDGQEVGATPLDLPVSPGRHEITARWNGRDARPRTVQVADAAEQSIAFDFRSTSSASKRKSPRSKKEEDDSVLTKVGRTFQNIFSGGGKNKR